MFEELARALYETMFSLVYGITAGIWGLDSVLLYLAYMLHNLRTHLVLDVFSPVLDIFLGSATETGGALIGIIRASFFLALLVLALSYIARPFFPNIKIVDPGKLVLWGGLTIMLMGTGAASNFYQQVEGFREGLSAMLRTAVFSDAMEDPSQLGRYFDAGPRYTPITFPPEDPRGIPPMRGYLDPNVLLGYDIAANFMRATMDDVLHPINVLPQHYDTFSNPHVSFYAVFWHESPPAILAGDTANRAQYLNDVAAGLVRLLLGIIPCIFAILEAVIFLCLTIATGVLFCTLPIALIFAYFEYTAPIASELIKSYFNIFVKTMMISVLFAIISLLLLAGAMVGNPVVLLGTSIVGVLFGVNFADDSLRTVIESARSFTRSLGQVTGAQLRMGQGLAGAAKTAGAMVGTGAMGLLSGAGGVGALGMALGANKSLYALGTGAAALGWGRKGGAGTKAFQRGMLTAGMTGGRVMSPVVFRQMYQQRQARRAESAADKYKRSFEEYQEGLEKQRQGFREGREKEPEIDQQMRAWKAGEREEPPELPEHLQKMAESARQELDDPFMGGYLPRGFAATLPRPQEKGMPTLRDLFPGDAARLGALGGAAGGGGAMPRGGVGALGGEALGSADNISYDDVMERLQNNMAVVAGPDGAVEAIPKGEVPPPESSFRVNAAAMNPADLLRQGYSLSLDEDGATARVWKSVLSPAGEGPTLAEEARRGIQRRQRVGQPPVAGAGAAPAARRVAVGDAPAIPLGGAPGAVLGGDGTPALAPTAGTHPQHTVTVNGRLAATLSRVFRQRPTGSGTGPGAVGDIANGIMRQGTRVRAFAGAQAQSGAAAQELRRKVETVIASSLQELRTQGMDDANIGLLVHDAKGGVRPEFADYALQRATAPGGLLATEPAMVVGSSPQAEEDFALTREMGAWAMHPDATLTRAVREGMRASRIRGEQMPLTTLLPAEEAPQVTSVAVGQYSVATAMQTVVQKDALAQQGGQGIAYGEALATLTPHAGESAAEVYRCMETYGAAQSVSVVQQTERLVSQMTASGMQANDILHTVYAPTGGVRPEFLEVVISGSQDGASAFVRTAAGRQDLQTLVGAGLGGEVAIAGPAVIEAMGQSVAAAGAGNATAADVASRLHVPSTVFRSNTAPMNSFLASVRTCGLQAADIQGIMSAGATGQIDPAAREQLRTRLMAEKGFTPEVATYAVDQLYSLSRSMGGTPSARAPRVLGKKST